MNRCLRDRTLLLLHEGEGSESDRAHLRACLRCAGRYQQMGLDLEVIDQALEQAPPLRAARRHPSDVRRRSVAVAVALAVIVVFAGVEAWRWRESVSWVRPQATGGDADTLRFLAEVSAVLSSTGDASPPDFADVAAMPETGWSDEWDAGQLFDDNT